MRSWTLIPPPDPSTWRRTRAAVWLGISRSTTETLCSSLAVNKEKCNYQKWLQAFKKWVRLTDLVYLPNRSGSSDSYWRSPRSLLITWISSSKAKKTRRIQVISALYILTNYINHSIFFNQTESRITRNGSFRGLGSACVDFLWDLVTLFVSCDWLDLKACFVLIWQLVRYVETKTLYSPAHGSHSRGRGSPDKQVKEARNSFYFPQTSFINSFPNTVRFIVSVWNLPQK